MAEKSNTCRKSDSQITRKPPNTVPNPLRQLNPRKHPRANGKTNHSNVDIHNSPYFKIRSLVQELRPHVVEVLQTPDFQNCNGADDIRKRMKLIMDLYNKQMTMEAAPMGKPENVSAHQPLSGASPLGKKTQVGRQGRKRSKQSKLRERVSTLEESLKPPPFAYGDNWNKGSYIVGGSSLGRNFITYRGSKPVHCGVTKEMHRDYLRQKRVKPCEPIVNWDR